MTTRTALVATPHPQNTHFYALAIEFADGTRQPIDRGAYALQPCQAHAETFGLPLRIETNDNKPGSPGTTERNQE